MKPENGITVKAPAPQARLDEEAPAPHRPPLSLRLLRWSMLIFVVGAFLTMGVQKPLHITGLDIHKPWGQMLTIDRAWYYSVDYYKHWFAARALLTGGSVYRGEWLWMGFNYPQATGLIFIWLGFFSLAACEYVYKFTLLALLIGCWALAWKWYRPAVSQTDHGRDARATLARDWGLTSAFLLAIYYPASTCVYLGNIDPVNAILALAMGAAALSGAPLVAGVCWAGLTLVKMVPLALIVPVLFWRQWRVLKGFMLVMAAYFFVLLALGRLGEEWHFVRDLIPGIPGFWRSITISPLAFVLRCCGFYQSYQDESAYLRLLRLTEIGWAGIFIALNLGMRRRGLGWTRALEGAFVFIPLLTPLLEYHHFVWILPAYFMQARRWTMGRMSGWIAAGLAAGYIMIDSAYQIIDLFPRFNSELLHFTALPGYLVVVAVTLADLLLGNNKKESSHSN